MTAADGSAEGSGGEPVAQRAAEDAADASKAVDSNCEQQSAANEMRGDVQHQWADERELEEAGGSA